MSWVRSNSSGEAGREAFQLEEILRWPRLNPPVNKRDLSTRETGEFAGENVGFGLNPGVAPVGPCCLSSNRRESTAQKNPRNVADRGEQAAGRFCQ